MGWTSVKDELPGNDIVYVKLDDERVLRAYSHQDGISWLGFYGVKTAHFQDSAHPNEFLHNVTHWKPINQDEKTCRKLDKLSFLSC